MKRLLRWEFALLGLLLGLAGLAVSGCSTTGELENRSDRPWNQPTRWETGLPSSIYDRRY
jgi:hypothetical protein